ncbi:aminoglycoside phosphotransferase family protein [Bacillaceae bacterium CLA-AA-H227]|uniref:Aminoglycoside phosphotransferase family protein n=1 Tax=Robertmurraya yapensis (ex Hitch et al 2024) TaxID=3133160 RepID=A0ACC6S522_9BACI
MVNINVDLVQSLMKEQFPEWSNLEIKPVENGGHDNRTFHLGEYMSVRLPSGDGYVSQVEKEHRWLPVLSKHLSLPISKPLAKGKPNKDYPYPWSIYKWLEGETVTHENIVDINQFARELGEFLVELQSIDASEGPFGGIHNYYRGCPLTEFKFNEWALSSLDTLGNLVDRERCLKIWDRALSTKWMNEPVWIHGDVAPGNLLVTNGRLSAVIDFGVMAVGDPAADLAMAWTFFEDKSRDIFLNTIGLDKDTEDRARGWALWKALTTCVWEPKESEAVKKAKKVIEILVNE